MFLGGNRQSMREVRARVRAILHPLPPVDMGGRWQCRCGRWLYVRYRGRFYCQRCGRRQNAVDTILAGRHFTFRDAFEANEKQARKDG